MILYFLFSSGVKLSACLLIGFSSKGKEEQLQSIKEIIWIKSIF